MTNESLRAEIASANPVADVQDVELDELVRVMAMQASDGFERLGGVLMQADPVTLWLSDQIRHYLN